jgi:hypothetical protein
MRALVSRSTLLISLLAEIFAKYAFQCFDVAIEDLLGIAAQLEFVRFIREAELVQKVVRGGLYAGGYDIVG